MNICSRFWCDNVHFNMSWQWIQSYLAGWLYSLVWCRFLTVCSTDNWTSLCCQTALWLNTRLQTICTLALLPSYVLFIAALTMESLSALHWSSLIYSRAFQLLVIIVHVRISLMHKSKLALWHALCVIFVSVVPLWGAPYSCSCLPVLQWRPWYRLRDHGDIQPCAHKSWQVHTGEQLLISMKTLERSAQP